MKSYEKIGNTIIIINYLRTHHYATSNDLTEELGVSRREIFRYIRELKNQKVVITHRGRYGYIELIL